MRAIVTPAALIALVGFGASAVAACMGVDPDGVLVEKPTSEPALNDAADTGSSEDKTTVPDDAGGTDVAAACSPIAGNLLDNPSFELGAAAWHLSSTGEARTAGAADCKTFLEADLSSSWDSVKQYVDLSHVTPSDAGTIALDFGVSLRSLDNVADGALLGFANDDSGLDATYLRSKSLPPGEWVTVTGTALIRPRANFYFSIGTEEQVRKLGIDRAWVVVRQ